MANQEKKKEFSPRNRAKDMALLKKLYVYMKPYMGILSIAGFCLLVSIAMQLLRPLLMKYVIDDGFRQSQWNFVVQMAALYFATIFVGLVVAMVQSYLLKRFGQRVIYVIRNEVFEKILRRSQRNFEKMPIGNLVTRVTNDTESLRALFTDVLLKLISSVFLLVGVVIFMFFLNVKLALLTCVMIVLIGVFTDIYRKAARKAFRQVRARVADSNAYVQEVLNFIVIIKTYLGEKIVARRYNAVSEEYLGAGLNEVRVFATFRPVVDVLYFLAVIVLFSYSNWVDSIVDAGTIFAALQYMQKVYQPLQDIADKYSVLQQSLAGAERIIPILEEDSHISLEAKHMPEEFRSIRSITFDHVWFAYEGDQYVLKDISFTIRKGEFLGIVGPSGSGKTTIFSLLMGFISPTKGRILINGKAMDSYDTQISRALYGFVFQDSHLFKGSIRDNLVLFKEDIGDEQLIEATKKAHLYNLIQKLPEGFETPVGYLGSLLSGGQKQLLSLARALVEEKPILLFDEATANIDSETERMIQDSIEDVRGEKTIISIAHRLSTIRDADSILYVLDGEIVERGSYKELMDKEGTFYRLWSKASEIY